MRPCTAVFWFADLQIVFIMIITIIMIIMMITILIIMITTVIMIMSTIDKKKENCTL